MENKRKSITEIKAEFSNADVGDGMVLQIPDGAQTNVQEILCG